MGLFRQIQKVKNLPVESIVFFLLGANHLNPLKPVMVMQHHIFYSLLEFQLPVVETIAFSEEKSNSSIQKH